jgi:hypothetical protein
MRTLKFEPFPPGTLPDQWEGIGGGMQRNKRTGEEKPTSPTLATVTANPNIIMPPIETAEQKARGTALGTEWEAVQNEARSAAQIIDTVRITRAMKAPTGKLAETREAIGGYLAELGYKGNLAKDATDLQKLTNISADYVLGKQIEQKGVQSEGDAIRMRNTFAQIRNTEEANDFILRIVEGQKTRQMEKADFYDTWAADPARRGSVAGASKAWREYIRTTPLIGVDPDTKAPVFLNEFVTTNIKANPAYTPEEIIGIWRKTYGR